VLRTRRRRSSPPAYAIGAASDPTMLKRSPFEVAGAGYIACSPASQQMPCLKTDVNANAG